MYSREEGKSVGTRKKRRCRRKQKCAYVYLRQAGEETKGGGGKERNRYTGGTKEWGEELMHAKERRNDGGRKT